MNIELADFIRDSAFKSGKEIGRLGAGCANSRIIELAKKGQEICTCPARYLFDEILEIIKG